MGSCSSSAKLTVPAEDLEKPGRSRSKSKLISTRKPCLLPITESNKPNIDAITLDNLVIFGEDDININQGTGNVGQLILAGDAMHRDAPAVNFRFILINDDHVDEFTSSTSSIERNVVPYVVISSGGITARYTLSLTHS